MKKIESLNPEQTALMETIRDKWINFSLGKDDTKDELARDKFVAGIRWLYSMSKLTDPFVLVVDSPLAAQYAVGYYNEIQKKYKAGKEVSSQVYGQVSSQVYDQVYGQVYGQVYDQVYGQFSNQVSSQVYDQVYGQVSNQVSSQVSSQVYDQVYGQVYDQVSNQVSSQVYDQVYDQVYGQVYGQVYDQVYGQVRGFLYFSYEDNSWMSGFASWYDYWKEAIGYSHADADKYLEYLGSGVFMSILLDGLAVGCRRPTKVYKNDEGRLHNENGPALEWRDGYTLYALNGVRFPEDLFKKVTSGSMPFQDILAIEDIDQRTQAMKYGDIGGFLTHAKAKILDEREKKTPQGNLIFYKLYMIPQGEIFTKDAYYMVYTDPSTMKQYMSGVEPFKTVAEAMGWKMQVTPEQWERLVPLVTEA